MSRLRVLSIRPAVRQERFGKSVAAVDVAMFFEFFVEVSGIKTLVMSPIEVGDGLDL